MKIAVINEVSGCHRNTDIVAALEYLGHEVLNLGMSNPAQKPELTYLHTGLMSAIALNLGIADFVVGGCGTGQGYLNAALQYPGVTCGLLIEPLDAWLFTRINDGNCVSLALNKGYGWAAEKNLPLLFAELFPEKKESGYPAQRVDSQRESRERLNAISKATHKSLDIILPTLPMWLLEPVFTFASFKEALLTAKPCALLDCCRKLMA